MPYEYNSGIRRDVEWFLLAVLAPAFLGLINVGQIGLLALHFVQRRRQEPLERCELAGVITTCTIGVMFAAGALAANSRSVGLLLILFSLLTMLGSAGVAIVSLCGLLVRGERPTWRELHGALASLVPGGWFAYAVVTSFPVC